ncbi:MAG: M48 family metalloprotease [Acidimicrobiales bacterium]
MRRSREAQQAAVRASREVLDRAATRRDDAWRRAADDNRRRSLIVVGVPMAIGLAVALVGIVVLPLLIVGLLLIVGWALIAALSWRAAVIGAGARIGGMTPAEAVDAGVLPALAAERYQDVAESLCAALGLPVPRLLVLVDQAPNSMVSGVRPAEVRLLATSGLLSMVERIELEGVLAHELAHVKRLDTLSGGLSVALLHGGRRGLPGSARLASWLEGPNRELEADLATVRVTRYPPGLINALAGIDEAASSVPSTSVQAGLLADTASQWIVPLAELQPSRSAATSQADEGVFGITERLEVLREL